MDKAYHQRTTFDFDTPRSAICPSNIQEIASYLKRLIDPMDREASQIGWDTAWAK